MSVPAAMRTSYIDRAHLHPEGRRRGVMSARARGRGAMLTFGAKVKDACGLFVGFSDDRRVEVVRFGVVVFVLVIVIVVGVSRRHRVAHDGGEAPVDQPARNSRGCAGSCRPPVGCCDIRRTDVKRASSGSAKRLHCEEVELHFASPAVSFAS